MSTNGVDLQGMRHGWARQQQGYHGITERRPYEQLEFAPVKTERHPILFRRLGFSAVTTRVKEVS